MNENMSKIKQLSPIYRFAPPTPSRATQLTKPALL